MKTLLVIASFFIFASPTDVKQTQGPVKVLPPGETLIYSPIVLKSGESLIGSPFGSTLKLADGANCPVIIIGGLEEEPLTETTNVYVSSVNIDGNFQGNIQYEGWGGNPHSGGKYDYIRNNGITVRRASKVVIEKVNIYNARSGGVVVEKSSSDLILIDSKLTNNFFDGLALYDSRRIFGVNLEINSNNYAGISIDLEVFDCSITFSDVSKNKKEGVFIRHSQFNRFQNLTMFNNGGPAIFLAKSELPNSAAKHNIFSKISFSGNLKTMQINDAADCIGNLLVNPDYSLEENLVTFTK